MSTQKTLLTAEEFFRLYSHKDGRYELVDGEVVEMAPANEQHGAVALNIGGAFLSYSRRYGVGRASVETGYVLRRAPDMVRGPDVAFVVAGKDEWESLSDRFSSDAPDIAVEVVSPSNTAAQVERKVEEYLAAGSQRVWVAYLVHPQRGGPPGRRRHHRLHRRRRNYRRRAASRLLAAVG